MVRANMPMCFAVKHGAALSARGVGLSPGWVG
jgi:hypothetical protein